ncbi:MAG: DUF551 domain-containing protein [Citrobacter koseri]|nr:DUF551 domain-containing protein [Citrobacter koseri]
MGNRYEIAEKNGMSREFVDWFFDNKKNGCGNVWFMMMAAMWEGWKGNADMQSLPGIQSAPELNSLQNNAGSVPATLTANELSAILSWMTPPYITSGTHTDEFNELRNKVFYALRDAQNDEPVTEIQVYCADTKEQMVGYMERNETEGWFRFASLPNGGGVYCKPTHWMPLPAAPQQEVK